jgi:hypothetical protein
MRVLAKRLALGALAIGMMGVTVVSEAPLRLGFIRSAEAFIFFHPIATAAVVGAVASSTANASAAAAANANAAAAEANASAMAAQAARAPAGPPPVGTIVTTLPPGCVTTTLNSVAYERCGSTYYATKMLGTNLVFVVAQP